MRIALVSLIMVWTLASCTSGAASPAPQGPSPDTTEPTTMDSPVTSLQLPTDGGDSLAVYLLAADETAVQRLQSQRCVSGVWQPVDMQGAAKETATHFVVSLQYPEYNDRDDAPYVLAPVRVRKDSLQGLPAAHASRVAQIIEEGGHLLLQATGEEDEYTLVGYSEHVGGTLVRLFRANPELRYQGD